MRLAFHLLKRPSSLYFRIAVPPDLRQHFGNCSEIRRSLKTHDSATAIILACRLATAIRQQFEQLRGHMQFKPKNSQPPTPFELILTKKTSDGSVYTMDVDDNNPKIGELVERFQNPASPPQPAAGLLVSELIKNYIAGKARSNVKKATTDGYERDLSLLAWFENKSASMWTVADTENFMAVLDKLPANKSKHKAFDNKTDTEVIALNKELKLPVISNENKRKLIATASAFFNWCVKTGHVTRNPFMGGVPKRGGSTTKKARVRYEIGELQTLFDPTNYASRTKPCQFWLPLLALYTGARMNEICQLRREDILQDKKTSIYYFDINDYGEDKSLKNPTARRLVPFHPMLHKLKFLDYLDDLAERKAVRVFPHLVYEPKSGYARRPSDEWSTYTKKLGLYVRNKKVFHSFRHSCNVELKDNGIQEEYRCELLGHSMPSVNSEVYADPSRMDTKFAEIKRLKYDSLKLNSLIYKRGQFAEFFDKKFITPSSQARISDADAEKLRASLKGMEARNLRYVNEGQTAPPEFMARFIRMKKKVKALSQR